MTDTTDAFGLPPLSNNPPTDANPLRDRLVEQYADLVQRARDLAAMGERYRIERPSLENDEQAGRATNLLAQCKKLAKAIDAARKEEKEPYLEGGRTVDAVFKDIGAITAGGESFVTRILNDWQRKVLAEQREAERKAREAQEAERRRQEEEARKAAAENRPPPEPAPAPVELVAATKPTVQSEHGNQAIARTKWVWEVADLDQVPHQYITRSPNKAAIDAAVKAGTRDIAGLRIIETVETAIRAAR